MSDLIKANKELSLDSICDIQIFNCKTKYLKNTKIAFVTR
jgi:hypothetical protein